MRDLLSDLNMPDQQTTDMRHCIRYGKWCQQFLWHQLAL